MSMISLFVQIWITHARVLPLYTFDTRILWGITFTNYCNQHLVYKLVEMYYIYSSQNNSPIPGDWTLKEFNVSCENLCSRGQRYLAICFLHYYALLIISLCIAFCLLNSLENMPHECVLKSSHHVCVLHIYLSISVCAFIFLEVCEWHVAWEF